MDIRTPTQNATSSLVIATTDASENVEEVLTHLKIPYSEVEPLKKQCWRKVSSRKSISECWLGSCEENKPVDRIAFGN